MMHAENQTSLFALSVLGQDRPGIVASVSECLLQEGFNIEDLTQTILQGEFAAIFLVSGPNNEDLDTRLTERLCPWDLVLKLKKIHRTCDELNAHQGEPFVITTTGPDSPGQIAALSSILYKFNCNITNLKAVNHDATFSMIFEVDIPADVALTQLKTAVKAMTQEFGLDWSVQHREIFEAINRI